jgi:tetratricopeptide (TPR) repeat protein
VRLVILSIFSLFLISCGSSGSVVTVEKSKKSLIDEAVQMDFDRKFFRANQEKILGNETEALRLFDACLRIKPGHAASLYESGRILRYRNRPDEAMNRLSAAAKADPENKYYHLELADQAFDIRHWKLAISEMEEVIRLDPYQRMHYQQLVQIQLASGDLKSAIATFDRMEEVFGSGPEMQLEKQELLIKSGDMSGAVEVLQGLIEQFPSEARYYALLAEVYRSLGRTEESIKLYDKLRALEPDNAFIQLSMAEYHSEMGDKIKAFEYLYEAFRNENLDIDTKIRYLLKFYSLSDDNDTLTRDAFKLAKMTVTVHPKDPKSHTMLGDFYTRENKLQEARDSYRKSVELFSDNYAVWSQLILIESQLEDYPLMLEECSKAIDLFPNQVNLYYLKSVAHSQLKQYPEAIQVINTALPMAELNPALKLQLLSSLGDACYFAGDYEQSDKAYERALEIDPNSLYVLNNYSYFLSLRKEKLEKAKEMAKRCVEQEPTSPTYLDTYAWVLFQSDDFEAAKKALELAINYGGSSSGEILEHYGDVLNALEDYTGAIKHWQQAIEKGQDKESLKQKINAANSKL